MMIPYSEIPFCQLPYEKRYKIAGEIAENAFERYCDKRGLKYVRYGLTRSSFKRFHLLPAQIRMTPDYLVETPTKHFQVEVKGCGRNPLKIKERSIEAMAEWNKLMPLRVFVYNSVRGEAAWISFKRLLKFAEISEYKEFEIDGVRYFEIDQRMLQWRPLAVAA